MSLKSTEHGTRSRGSRTAFMDCAHTCRWFRDLAMAFKSVVTDTCRCGGAGSSFSPILEILRKCRLGATCAKTSSNHKIDGQFISPASRQFISPASRQNDEMTSQHSGSIPPDSRLTSAVSLARRHLVVKRG